MRRLMHFVDWRFVFSTAFLMLVLLVGISWWADAQEARAKDHRIDRLIVQNDALIEQAKADRAASIETQNNLRALLVYIRAHGYYIPASLIPAEASGSDTIRAESGAERSRRIARSGGGSPKASSPSGGQSSGGGSPATGSGDSGSGKSDDHRDKPKKDRGGNDSKPDKGHDRPEKAKGKK